MKPPKPPSPPGARPVLWTVLAFGALMVLPLPVAVGLGAAAIAVRTGVALARRARTRAEPPLIPDQALRAHGLILGATGSGKSTTLLTILGEQIRRGSPVVAIDLKGSPRFAAELRASAEASGRRFTLWTPDGAAHWNPLAHGNATELKDKLIATERFTEPHYRRAAERYVQMAIQVMQESHPERPVTLAGVVAMLEPPRLAAATRGLPRERGEYVRAYVSALTPDQLSAVRGLSARLALLTESHTGRFLEPGAAGSGNATLDLRQTLGSDDVVLFSLNSSSYGGLAAQLGTLAVQDLVAAAGSRLATATEPPLAVVGIDEFSALGSDNVMALLARGREAGVGVVLATQELADLDRAAHGLRDQVLGNTAIKIAHRQDVPESAETVARLAGQLKVWDRSYQQNPGPLGGRRTSLHLVDRYAIEPEQVRSLQTGEAVVIVKSPQASARVTRIRRQVSGASSAQRPASSAQPPASSAQPPAPGVTR